MIGRALDAGAPVSWATGDEVYGADRNQRADLIGRDVGCVLALACNHRFTSTRRADQIAALLPTTSWHRLSCGAGRRASGFTTGRSSTPPIPPTPTSAGTGGWSAAASRPASWRSTAPTHPDPGYR